MKRPIRRRAATVCALLGVGIVAAAIGVLRAPPAHAVGPTPSTTTLTANVNPAVYGQPVTLTATVTPTTANAATPSGQVKFLSGTTGIATKTLVNGSASYTTAYAVGTHSITASYQGDVVFAISTSAVLSEVINKTPTTSVIVSGTNPSTLGTSVTFIATTRATAPGAGTPSSGTIKFYNGGSLLATVTPTNGTATYATSGLPVGTNSMTVVFSGSASYLGSTSPAWTQNVNPAVTSTTVTSDLNPASFGGSVTFTGTVGSVAGTPTGSVTYSDGVTALGTAPLVGGQAALTVPGLTIGSHPIVATYSGATNFAASTSSSLTQVVGVAPAAIGLTSTPNPSVFGSSFALTVTVSSTVGTPSGTVSFSEGATSLGSAPLSGGTATLPVSGLHAGTHAIVASYAGDGTYAAATSAVLNQSISAAPTATALASDTNPAPSGAGVTYTTTVNSAAGTPSGSVNLFDGTTLIGNGTLASGVATITISNLDVGSHLLTAGFVATSDFAASTSGAVTQVIDPIATTTAIVSNLNPSSSGDPLALTATVIGGTAPSGTVTFTDGAMTLGTSTLSAGSALLTTSTLAPGGHSIVASYGGDTTHAASTSAALIQNVNGTSTVSLTTTPNPSALGEAVTLTATVEGGGGIPTGTATFRDGTTVVGTATLNSGSGVLTLSNLTAGTHSITATYGGDPTFGGSTSAALTQTVTFATSTTGVISSSNPALVGQSVTFTAGVSGAAGTPTGIVTFTDGATSLGTATLASGQAAVTTAALAPGSHTIVATYSGDGTYQASVSPTLTQTITPIVPTSTALVSNSNPSAFGVSVSLTATVSASASPTGTVTFTDGVTAFGSAELTSGQATLTTTGLATGTHSITASYAGAIGFSPSTSSTLTQVVDRAATSTVVTSGANPASTGVPVSFTVTVSSTAGVPTGSVELRDGSTAIGNASLTNGSATITVSSLGVGTHSLTAAYLASANYASSVSSALSQSVLASTTTTLGSSANPSTYGQSVTVTATVTSAGGTPTGSVTFSDGAATLGVASLTDGQATLTTSALTGGPHSMVAVYGGGGGFVTSTSGALNQTVVPIATTTTAVASPLNVSVGQTVSITATVSAAAGAPAGLVTFRDGATPVGSASLSAGQANLNIATLAAGTHSLAADYVATPNFAASSGSAGTVTVVDNRVYVDKANPSCRNTGTGAGTVATPYCTIGAAAAKVVAGQTVQVATGAYSERVVMSVTGTQAAPITFTSAPGASVSITSATNAFTLSGKSWITIHGFDVNHTGAASIVAGTSTNITIDGNHVSYAGQPVSGSTAAGIKLTGTTNSAVVNNITDHNSDAGILITSSDSNVIAHNESFSNARGYVRAAAGIDLRTSTGELVFDNVSHDNEDSGINVWTGLSDGSSTIYDNVTYSNGDHGIDVHNSVDSHIVANTVYNNYDSGIEMTTSVRVTLNNNVSVDNGIGSLRTAGNVRADVSSVSGGCVIQDDLVFLRTPGQMFDWNGVKYSSLAALQAATGMESRGIQADPLFTSTAAANFRLLAGSPAIDSANSGAVGQPALDFDGVARYDGPAANTGIGPITYADRGAFEYHP